jgi:hypothetical protein
MVVTSYPFFICHGRRWAATHNLIVTQACVGTSAFLRRSHLHIRWPRCQIQSFQWEQNGCQLEYFRVLGRINLRCIWSALTKNSHHATKSSTYSESITNPLIYSTITMFAMLARRLEALANGPHTNVLFPLHKPHDWSDRWNFRTTVWSLCLMAMLEG